MLIYNPTYDIYHGVFRILRILEILEIKPYRIEFIRIADFYFLFPHLFSDIRMPNKFRKLKSQTANLKTNYNEVPNHKGLLRELLKCQLMAIKSIAGAGLIDKEKFQKGVVVRTSKQLPEKLIELIKLDKEYRSYINDVILALSELTLQGPDGLKARTKLMEFRYDIV